MKLTRSSKAQAAVEFLTTYGWMFIVVLVVFGAIAYFGFFDVKEQLPDRCAFETGFSCPAYVAYEDGSYAFEARNEFGRAVNITSIICDFPFTDERVLYNFSLAAIQPGESRVYFCNQADLLTPPTGTFQDKQLFEMRLVYTNIEVDPIPKVITGELFTQLTDDLDLYQSYRDDSQTTAGTFSYLPS